jgi:hypothetical protein
LRRRGGLQRDRERGRIERRLELDATTEHFVIVIGGLACRGGRGVITDHERTEMHGARPVVGPPARAEVEEP